MVEAGAKRRPLGRRHAHDLSGLQSLRLRTKLIPEHPEVSSPDTVIFARLE